MANDKEQYINLDIQPDGKMIESGSVVQLHLWTHKGSNGIVSTASVCWLRDGFRTFAIGSGYSKRVAHYVGMRGTQKAIDTQHAAEFTPEVINGIKDEAIAFYAAKVRR